MVIFISETSMIGVSIRIRRIMKSGRVHAAVRVKTRGFRVPPQNDIVDTERRCRTVGRLSGVVGRYIVRVALAESVRLVGGDGWGSVLLVVRRHLIRELVLTVHGPEVFILSTKNANAQVISS